MSVPDLIHKWKIYNLIADGVPNLYPLADVVQFVIDSSSNYDAGGSQIGQLLVVHHYQVVRDWYFGELASGRIKTINHG